MKFKKLLLPFAASAALVATTIPFVTSCNKDKTKTYHYTNKSVEEYEWITPKGGSATDYTVTKMYLEDVAKNPRILADDAAYASFVGDYDNAVGDATMDFTITNVDVEGGRLSFKSDSVMQLSADVLAGVYYEMENVPVRFYYGTMPTVDVPTWNLNCAWLWIDEDPTEPIYAPLFMQGDKDWGLTLKLVQNGEAVFDRTYSYKSSYDDLYNLLLTYVYYFYIPSYYLKDTTHTQ